MRRTPGDWRSAERSHRTVALRVIAAEPQLLCGQGEQWPAMRVATYNVKHGDNGDGRVDLRRLGAACAALGADVLAIQEVDRFARRTRFRDELAVVGRATEVAELRQRPAGPGADPRRGDLEAAPAERGRAPGGDPGPGLYRRAGAGGGGDAPVVPPGRGRRPARGAAGGAGRTGRAPPGDGRPEHRARGGGPGADGGRLHGGRDRADVPGRRPPEPDRLH